MNVKAFFQAATIENAPSPYNTIHLKIFHPAIEADRAFKIVIFFSGINCSNEQYQWLAVRLAQKGLVVVTFNWVAENLPGAIALTPGVDLKMLMPDTYGTGITASALPTILGVLDSLQAQGTLAGRLDLNQIILGGHSAGGRVAIESAQPKLYPQIVAAFAYGAHTAGAVQAGYPPNTILPLPDAAPLLLMGGTRDGVIANMGNIYGVTWEEATTPIERTFTEAIAKLAALKDTASHKGIAGGREDSYLLLLEGANHFSLNDPVDPTATISHLDFEATQPVKQLQDFIAKAIALFIDAHVNYQTTALETLEQMLTTKNPLIATFERK